MKAILKYAALFSLISLNCDLFSVRSVEPPETSRANFQEPATPEILLQNLKNAFIDKSSQNYVMCLADSIYSGKNFKFIPSARALQLGVDFNKWTILDEEQYFKNLINNVKDNAVLLEISINEYNHLAPSEAFYYLGYYLYIPSMESDVNTIYSGEMRLLMAKDGRAYWTIAEWEDSGKEYTWSELKGRFH